MSSLRMKRFPITALAALLMAGLVSADALHAQTVTVDPQQAVIVITPEPSRYDTAAAAELQKHLKLITQVRLPIVAAAEAGEARFRFHVGVTPEADERPMQPMATRWHITESGAWFYGDTEKHNPAAQFAVYGFLEEQLGVTWIEPGDEGIVYTAQPKLTLQAGSFEWVPQLVFRKIRQGHARIAEQMPRLAPAYQEYADFQLSLEEHNAFAEATMLWQSRMRMGGRRPAGGHAFSKWWDRFGETHPEYFALNKFGKREPVPLAKAEQTNSFVKICPSNPAVAEQVIADWLPRSEVLSYADVGVNDGAQNFCECADCRALDVPRPGERPMAHLTDRYVHLANTVARRVREHREDANAAMYAYLTTLHPPRALRVEPNVVVQVVPYVIPMDLKITRDLLNGWYRAGATMLAFRPNYHTKYMTSAMPLGLEKQMFDVFQIAVENGCISAEYDSLVHHWPVTGLADYALARAMAEPGRPFEHWEQKYCDAFGPASEEVKQYFRYWRQELWEQRLMPEIEAICAKGGAGDFTRGLFWSLGKYYTLADFEKTQAILDQAADKPLNAAQRQRLEELRLANRHARLMFEAITAPPMDKSDYADALLAFRRTHQHDLKLPWIGVFAFEVGNGDLTGLKLADQMEGYLKPWLPTELFWRFRLDPDDRGRAERWYAQPWSASEAWDQLRTDRFWEKQFEFDEVSTLSEALTERLPDYDGVGWYTTRVAVPDDWKERAVYLRFGSVDESAWVYVNGQLAGERVYAQANDWKTPFEIRIDDVVDWSAEQQVVSVRVEDTSGMGGIWRPVWLVSKTRDE